MWTTIKAKLFLGIGLLVAALLGAVKIQSARLERANDKNKVLTAVNVRNKEIATEDKKTDARTESRRANARNEIKYSDSSFADPNRLRKPKNDSS